jgi:hypothetical protein
MVVAAIGLGGCRAAEPPAAPAAPPLPPGLPTAMSEAVFADAANRAGVAREAVRIDRVESVTWRDGSLGCPQPDRLYTQALVPGWRIALTAGPRAMVYHASRRGGWLWCPPGRAQEPLPRDVAI